MVLKRTVHMVRPDYVGAPAILNRIPTISGPIDKGGRGGGKSRSQTDTGAIFLPGNIIFTPPPVVSVGTKERVIGPQPRRTVPPVVTPSPGEQPSPSPSKVPSVAVRPTGGLEPQTAARPPKKYPKPPPRSTKVTPLPRVIDNYPGEPTVSQLPFFTPTIAGGAFDLGNMLGGLASEYIRARFGQPSYIPTTPFSGGPLDYATDTVQGVVCPEPRRRRRRRLLTQTDFSDLQLLKTITGNSEAFRAAVIKAVRR